MYCVLLVNTINNIFFFLIHGLKPHLVYINFFYSILITSQYPHKTF